jgi:spermidine/putrescine-binding protein
MSAFFQRFREKTDIRFVDTVFGDGATAFPSLKLNEHGSYDVLAYIGIP